MALKPRALRRAALHGNAKRPGAPRHAARHRARRIRAVAGRDVCRKVLGAAAREHLDHAADRVGAVQARRRSAQHLDALDLVERNRLERRGPGRRRGETNAVDQHQRLRRIRAAQEHAGHRRRSAVLDDFGAGLPLQQLGETLHAGARDLVAADDGDVGEEVHRRLQAARRRHRQRIEPLRHAASRCPAQGRTAHRRPARPQRDTARRISPRDRGRKNGTLELSASTAQPRAAMRARGTAEVSARVSSSGRPTPIARQRARCRPVSGLASLDRPPSRRRASQGKAMRQWLVGRPALAYRCGGSRGLARMDFRAAPRSRFTRREGFAAGTCASAFYNGERPRRQCGRPPVAATSAPRAPLL